MKRLIDWFRRFLGLLPPAKWEDGVVVSDPVYAAIYAKTVEWVRVVNPEAVIAPDFQLTVRVYDRWPPDNPNLLGKVLPPNVIAGDSHGTLCLAKKLRHNTALIAHECKHAITGESGHPDWLFPNG